MPAGHPALPHFSARQCNRYAADFNRRSAPLLQIFVSDGSKCDIGRLQLMFGADVTVALQVGEQAAAEVRGLRQQQQLGWLEACKVGGCRAAGGAV